MFEYMRSGIIFLMAMVIVGGSMFVIAHHTWSYVERQAMDGLDHRVGLEHAP
ncbi:MAG: hypothetical protein ACKOW3_07515 [Hyphomicrobium sp.]